jgi:hypothetical protein
LRNEDQGRTDDYTYASDGYSQDCATRDDNERQDSRMKVPKFKPYGGVEPLDTGSESDNEEEERRRWETLNEAAIERGKWRIRKCYGRAEQKYIDDNASMVHSDIDMGHSEIQDTMDFEALYRYQSVDFHGEHPSQPWHHRLQQPKHVSSDFQRATTQQPSHTRKGPFVEEVCMIFLVSNVLTSINLGKYRL